MTSYKLWRDSVIRILIYQKLIKPTQIVIDDIYIDYYNDGYSPSEAIKDDMGVDSIKFLSLNQPKKD